MRAIAAVSKNGIIGNAGKIPEWNCREDLKFFKEFTMGKDIVMGRKTYEKMPVLKGRRLTVLSKFLPRMGVAVGNSEFWPYGVTDDINSLSPDSIVCGGAEIYKLLFPYCSDLHLTIIDKIVKGDTRMPNFNEYFAKRELVQEGSGYKIFRYYK